MLGLRTAVVLPVLTSTVVLLATPCAAFESSDWQLDAGILWDDNINRAKAGPDVRADSIYSLNLGKSRTYSLTPNARLIVTANLSGERFQTYTGLGNISAGAEAVYQYRGSAAFDATTLGLFGRVSTTKYQTDLRSGASTSFGVSLSQALTDRISGFAALAQNKRNANSAVFNTADTSFRMNLDYAWSRTGTLYMGAEYRDGDIVSTGQSSLENITIAKVFVADDAYTALPFFSYRFGGTTVLTTLGYNWALGPKSSVDFSWRWVESTPLLRPTWATSARSYVTNQVGLNYLMRF